MVSKEVIIDFQELVKDIPETKGLLYHQPKVLLDDLIMAYWSSIYYLESEGCPVMPEYADRNKPNMEIINLPEYSLPIRDVRSKHLGKFLSVEGMIRKSSEIRSEIVIAYFKCEKCNAEVSITQTLGDLIRPKYCKGCGARSFRELKELHEFRDVQRVTIQENPEGLGGGEQPKSIEVKLIGNTVGKIQAGDTVKLNGIVSPMPVKKDSSTFMFFIEGNSFEKDDSDYKSLDVTPDELLEYQNLSKRNDLIDYLVSSFAPGIYGMYDLKLGILLCLFGGVTTTDEFGIMRGDTHLLLVGDAGVAKSKLMKSIQAICPRFVYASGKSSTGVGLTAAVQQDSFDGKWVLEAGAAVLASGGVLIIDEIDKMSKEDRSSMHEVLEEQTITINKATISATLKTVCSVIAACNPKSGRFDDYSTLSDQIGLPPSLISRFDLVYTIKDVPNSDRDGMIAAHILERKRGKTVEKYSATNLMKYISIAKQVTPKLTEEVEKELVDCYVNTRQQSANGNVTITARQLEGMARLSEAFARMRLSDLVSKEDVKNATALYTRCVDAVCTDENGNTDIDKLCNEKSSKSRSLFKQLLDIIPETQNISFSEILGILGIGVDSHAVLNALDALSREGEIFEPKLKQYRRMKK